MAYISDQEIYPGQEEDRAIASQLRSEGRGLAGAVPVSESALGKSLGNLDHTLELVIQLALDLENRLDLVTTPKFDGETSNLKETASVEKSQLVGSIDMETQKAKQVEEILRSLMLRLQV